MPRARQHFLGSFHFHRSTEFTGDIRSSELTSTWQSHGTLLVVETTCYTYPEKAGFGDSNSVPEPPFSKDTESANLVYSTLSPLSIDFAVPGVSLSRGIRFLLRFAERAQPRI